MGKIIIPVGRSLGPFYDDKGELESYELHLGPRTASLDEDDMGVWACAHDEPEAQGELTFGRAELREAVRDATEGFPDEETDAAIERLLEAGALIELDPEGPIEDVLRAHRFIPNGHAFGNRPDHPDECGIGPADEPVVSMSGWVYSLWARSYLDGSIWHAAETFADDLPDVTAEDVAREFLEAVPVIISVDCGYLEPLD